jgi:hypothetical protein
MKAAVVNSADGIPEYGDFPEAWAFNESGSRAVVVPE